jgi:penicillin amidase
MNTPLSSGSPSGRRVVTLVLAVLVAVGVEWALHVPLGPLPPLGVLFDPADGLYRTARNARHPAEAHIDLAVLDGPVRVVRDERGVPHIFAESDRDAIVALGYVVAQDRLFQLDFIPRVAAGRLSEAFGESAVGNDRFLRRTGMDWGAHKTLREMEEAKGLEYDLATWYAAGVNAYLDGLDEADLPFEFRLLGYRPDRYSPLQTIRLQQYMNFDVS